jgi:hypothetical protein
MTIREKGPLIVACAGKGKRVDDEIFYRQTGQVSGEGEKEGSGVSRISE